MGHAFKLTNTVIYIPGIQHALSLHTKINDGSFSKGLYANAMNALGPIGDITKSILESPQFIPEVLGDLWEVIKEHKTTIIATTVAFVAAEIAVGALGAMPTGITQILAMLLQGLITLVVGVGAIQSMVAATAEGLTWIKTAWNAKGHYAQVKQASKAFLRMLTHVALAALAIVGTRASAIKLKGLHTKYQKLGKLPMVQSASRSDLAPTREPIVPQGFTLEQFELFSQRLKIGASHLGKDIRIHGSRASGTAKPTSDVDVMIRVTPEQFNAFVKQFFGVPNPGSSFEKTMLHAIKTGKIQRGEIGLRNLGRSLEKDFGYKTDISIIKIGGAFDNPPWMVLR